MSKRQEEVIDLGLLQGGGYSQRGDKAYQSSSDTTSQTTTTTTAERNFKITSILVIQAMILIVLLMNLCSFAIIVYSVFKRGYIQLFFIPKLCSNSGGQISL
jgi:hypothetical protein